MGYSEPLKEYSESTTIIAPITIPAPTLFERRQQDVALFSDSAGCPRLSSVFSTFWR